jgi:hypothetical protein
MSERVGNAKQVVYRYNGDPKSEETEPDLYGGGAVPEKDAVLKRKGKSWTVVKVDIETSGKNIPIYRIYLTDKFQGEPAHKEKGVRRKVS